MGRVSGKVALVTGAARGQGRSHAVRLAEEGADIVALDVLSPVETVPYNMPGAADLDETVKLVEAEERRILARQADVRNQGSLDEVVAAGLDQFGRIDIVVANAGIFSWGSSWLQSDAQWQQMIDINLNGVWRTVKAALPAMIDAGNGGSIVLTSSVLGLRGAKNASSYSAAKHGVVGLTKSLAGELGPYNIRVNAVNPTNVGTDMILNKEVLRLFRPELDDPVPEDAAELMAATHPMQVPWVEACDVSNAVLFLASDESRYITGIALPIDAGTLAR
jgi:SDR family mycofactocin-dependent oxidoreductase